MINWLEQRLHLKYWLTRPSIARGRGKWRHFPGVFAAILIMWQTWTGVCIAPYLYERYTQTIPDQELYKSPLFHGGHRWGAHFFIFFVFVHFFSNLYRGNYRKPWELKWFSGIFLAIISGLFFTTGSLLVYYRKAEIVSGLYAQIPIIGNWIVVPDFYQLYVLHISILPMSLLTLLFLHLWLGKRSY